jgi:uncharacterized membrane protein
MGRGLGFIALVASLVGLSADLVVILSDDSPPLCGAYLFDCGRVIQTYGYVMGVSLSTLALVWFAAASMISLAHLIRPSGLTTRALLAWSAVGVVPLPYLVYTELTLGTLCLYCTIMHMAIILMFTATLLRG